MLTRGAERNMGCYVREPTVTPDLCSLALKSRDRDEPRDLLAMMTSTPSQTLKVITLKTGSNEPPFKMELPLDSSCLKVSMLSIFRAFFKMRFLELAFVKGYLLKTRLKNLLMRARDDGPPQPSQSRPASRARLCLMCHLRTLDRARACRLCRLMARLMAIDRRVKKW